MNTIFLIKPYFQHGTWVFDYAPLNTVAEAFVGGAESIINEALAFNNISFNEAKNGFALYFSAEFFPDYHLCVDLIGPDQGNGHYYQYKRPDGSIMKGWLCGYLKNFFVVAPKNIYFKVEKLS